MCPVVVPHMYIMPPTAKMENIMAGPVGANGSSGTVYEWLGIDQWKKFSDDVAAALTQVVLRASWCNDDLLP